MSKWAKQIMTEHHSNVKCLFCMAERVRTLRDSIMLRESPSIQTLSLLMDRITKEELYLPVY